MICCKRDILPSAWGQSLLIEKSFAKIYWYPESQSGRECPTPPNRMTHIIWFHIMSRIANQSISCTILFRIYSSSTWFNQSKIGRIWFHHPWINPLRTLSQTFDNIADQLSLFRFLPRLPGSSGPEGLEGWRRTKGWSRKHGREGRRTLKFVEIRCSLFYVFRNNFVRRTWAELT